MAHLEATSNRRLAAASKCGRRASRVWLEQMFLALATYFIIIKPILVGCYYVLIPNLLGEHALQAAGLLRGAVGSLPYATRVPDGATFYLLQRHPDLAATPAGRVVARRAGRAEGRHDVDAFIDGVLCLCGII